MMSTIYKKENNKMSELKQQMKQNAPIIKASKKPARVRPQGYNANDRGMQPAPNFRYDSAKQVWTRK